MRDHVAHHRKACLGKGSFDAIAIEGSNGIVGQKQSAAGGDHGGTQLACTARKPTAYENVIGVCTGGRERNGYGLYG